MMREFLISEGYGAGWSTWNSQQYKKFLLFDKGLIKLAKDKASESEVQKYLKKKDINIYSGGWDGITVHKLGDKEKFIIEEYDGAESIKNKDDIDWV